MNIYDISSLRVKATEKISKSFSRVRGRKKFGGHLACVRVIKCKSEWIEFNTDIT